MNVTRRPLAMGWQRAMQRETNLAILHDAAQLEALAGVTTLQNDWTGHEQIPAMPGPVLGGAKRPRPTSLLTCRLEGLEIPFSSRGSSSTAGAGNRLDSLPTRTPGGPQAERPRHAHQVPLVPPAAAGVARPSVPAK